MGWDMQKYYFLIKKGYHYILKSIFYKYTHKQTTPNNYQIERTQEQNDSSPDLKYFINNIQKR